MSSQPFQRSATLLLTRIVTLLEWTSSIVLMVMMLLTFVDVVGRYLLNKPVFGAAELVSTLLAFTIFTGLGLVNARDQHIGVDLFEPMIRQSLPRFHSVLTRGSSLLAMALLVFVLVEQAVEAHTVSSTTVVLEIPLSWVAGLVAALSVISLVCQILELLIGDTTPEQITGESA